MDSGTVVRCFRTLAFIAGVFATLPAGADVIDFDALAGGINPPLPLPPNHTALATFSTEPGAELLVFASAGVVGVSAPNALTAAADGDEGYFRDLYVDFTSPVENLLLDVASDNDSGHIADINVFSDGSLVATLPVVGNGDFSDPIPMDLTPYSQVTRIELVNDVDFFGLVIDNLSFTPNPTNVPEPLALSLLGAASAWMYRRRRW